MSIRHFRCKIDIKLSSSHPPVIQQVRRKTKQHPSVLHQPLIQPVRTTARYNNQHHHQYVSISSPASATLQTIASLLASPLGDIMHPQAPGIPTLSAECWCQHRLHGCIVIDHQHVLSIMILSPAQSVFPLSLSYILWLCQPWVDFNPC